ncbi:MAG: PDZ domain-containing protein, partial [Acidobacteriota bacterium]
MSLRRILGLAAVILPCVFAGAAEADPGAVVESVTPGSVGEKAGLQPGDLILAAPGGRIDSPYDLVSLEFEEAPRHGVVLRGKRGDQEMAWTLTAAEWGIEVRPGLPAGLAALYAEGGERLAAGDLAAVERAWRSAADGARNTGDGRLAAWFLDRLASRLAEAGKWAEADGAFGDALALLQRETDHPAAAPLLRNWGNA